MKNLKLSTCMKIFAKYDLEMHVYLSGKKESELNMSEVSGWARELKSKNEVNA